MHLGSAFMLKDMQKFITAPFIISSRGGLLHSRYNTEQHIKPFTSMYVVCVRSSEPCVLVHVFYRILWSSCTSLRYTHNSVDVNSMMDIC